MNHYEMIFIQFLHLLAHHPDFAITQESLPDMAKYAPNLFTAVLPRDILTPGISTFTSNRWVLRKTSRYCTTSPEKRRPCVTQNHTFIARFANLQSCAPHVVNDGTSEPLCSERACSAHHQRLSETTLVGLAKFPHESQASCRYFTSIAERRSRQQGTRPAFLYASR